MFCRSGVWVGSFLGVFLGITSMLAAGDSTVESTAGSTVGAPFRTHREWIDAIEALYPRLRNYVAANSAHMLQGIQLGRGLGGGEDDFDVRVHLTAEESVVFQLNDLNEGGLEEKLNLGARLVVEHVMEIRRRASQRFEVIRRNAGGPTNPALSHQGGDVALRGAMNRDQLMITMYVAARGIRVSQVGARSLRILRLTAQYSGGGGIGLSNIPEADVGASSYSFRVSSLELAWNAPNELERSATAVWLRPATFQIQRVRQDQDDFEDEINRILRRVTAGFIEAGAIRELRINERVSLYMGVALAVGMNLFEGTEGNAAAHLNSQAELGFLFTENFLLRGFFQLDTVFDDENPTFSIAGVDARIRNARRTDGFYFSVSYQHRRGSVDDRRQNLPYFQEPDGHSAVFTLGRNFSSRLS
jgi:hypothetical protein